MSLHPPWDYRQVGVHIFDRGVLSTPEAAYLRRALLESIRTGLAHGTYSSGAPYFHMFVDDLNVFIQINVHWQLRRYNWSGVGLPTRAPRPWVEAHLISVHLPGSLDDDGLLEVPLELA